MNNYKIETKGLNTYRTYKFKAEDKIDTVAVGMMLNNVIAGIVPVTVMHMDNDFVVEFNISSKVTLGQFLTGEIDKDRFLEVIKNIVDIISSAEEYMLDMELLQISKEDIYVNVGTLKVEILYYPLLDEKKPLDLNGFFKDILFTAEFNQTENCEYVIFLINFFNKNSTISLAELKRLIDSLRNDIPTTKNKKQQYDKGGKAAEARQEAPPLQSIIPAATVQPPMPAAAPAPQPVPILTPEPAAVIPDIQNGRQKEDRPKMNIFGKKKEGINEKKEKKEPKKKEKSKGEDFHSFGIEVPGMGPVKKAVREEASAPKESGKGEQTVPAGIQAVTLAGKTEQYQENHAYPVSNFGETTILQMPDAGETTVLNAGMMQAEVPKESPKLLRKKNNEKIPVNKAVFRIGKERNYVDYCISDNPAISRSHADIIAKEGAFYIIDNNSLNHTYLNGAQIRSQEPVKLDDSDIIILANEELEFRLY